MKYPIIIFFIFHVYLAFLDAQQNPINKGTNESLKLTKEQWIDDVRFFAENFKSKHKNPFTKYPVDTFDKKVNQLIQKIKLEKEINPIDIVCGIQSIIWLSADSHSSINSGMNSSLTYYPINIYVSKNDCYIIGVLPENKDLLGSKIISYNEIPIDSVIKKIAGLFYFDNPSWLKKNVTNVLVIHEILQYLGIVNSKLKIKVEVNSGETKEVTVTPMNRRNIMLSMTYIQRKGKPETEEKNGVYYWKKVLNNNILFVQYNRCKSYDQSMSGAIKKEIATKKDFPVEKINFALNNFIPFSDFSDSIMALLDKPEIKRLVFDMRYNSGGNSTQGTQLVERISKNEKINRKGRIYVITGRQTFSSAIINTCDFKIKTDAILIGEPTGGKPNHFGEVRSFTLPNSKFVISYSTKYFERVPGNPNSIEPNVPIEQTLEDYVNGVDPCLEYVMKLK